VFAHPLSHARIRRIDVQKAKKTKGVFAVLTASGEEGESGCQFPQVGPAVAKTVADLYNAEPKLLEDFERLSKLLLGKR
jgi:CO/xanthine dehydrogenase Mo-binding subunit